MTRWKLEFVDVTFPIGICLFEFSQSHSEYEILFFFFHYGFQMKKTAWRGELRKQKHLWFGKQKKHWEYLGWLVDCIETNRVNPAAAVDTLFKAVPPEQEQWDNPLLSCMMHWNVELIRQSNWVNICCCFIIILKWALSLCMPGMAKYLSAFLIEADSGVYVSTALNCPEI